LGYTPIPLPIDETGILALTLAQKGFLASLLGMQEGMKNPLLRI